MAPEWQFDGRSWADFQSKHPVTKFGDMLLADLMDGMAALSHPPGPNVGPFGAQKGPFLALEPGFGLRLKAPGQKRNLEPR